MSVARFQWININNLLVTVGLNSFGASKLGPIWRIYPYRTEQIEEGQKVLEIETSNYIFPLQAPLSGRLVEFNPLVIRDPSIISRDPEGKGWIYRLNLQPNLDACVDFMNNVRHETM